MATTHRTQASKTSKDATALLRKDHDTVRKLLGELEETTTRGAKKREALLMEIALEVEVHAAIEEEIFYPAFREKGESGEDEQMFLEAAEEHKLVHGVLPELQATDPRTELFGARAKVLKDLIEHHAEEEESEMFPRARELFSKSELQELGERLEERKGELIEASSRGELGGRRGARRNGSGGSSRRSRG
jgi:hemerythrin-like domain-containing protein